MPGVALLQRTETFDDYGTPYTDPRFDKFAAFHTYLESSFPSVFATLQVEKPQKFGLLVTYAGKRGHAALGAAALKPIVLMAHQDTVPVDPGTVVEWEHPPFSGHLDEAGWIWGVSLCASLLSIVNFTDSDRHTPARRDRLQEHSPRHPRRIRALAPGRIRAGEVGNDLRSVKR